MRNIWHICRHPYAAWIARLPIEQPHDELLKWLLRVVELGESCSVYTVHEAPRINYRRDQDGPIAPILERRYRSEGVVDLFGFLRKNGRPDRSPLRSCSARLSYFDRGGNEIETDVRDLGDLIAVEGSSRSNEHAPPIYISGTKIDYRDQQCVQLLRNRSDPRIRIRWYLFTDIWFPRVEAPMDRRPPPGRGRWVPVLSPNPLAKKHTPRLNRYLSGIKAITESVNGTWELDEADSGNINGLLAFMLDASGIRLDASLPAGFAEVPSD